MRRKRFGSPVRMFHRSAIRTLVAEQVAARASINCLSASIIVGANKVIWILATIARSIGSETRTVWSNIDAWTDLRDAC
jgi:hypothetical protein